MALAMCVCFSRKVMGMNRLLGFIVAVLLCFNVVAYSDIYTGELTDISGTGAWANDTGGSSWVAPTLTWTVTQNADQTWHYDYTLNVYKYDISHFIIEVSQSFSLSDMQNATALQGSFGSVELDVFSQGNGNPGMSGTVNGIKFDNTNGSTLQVSFDSARVPVWGDFYAKGGKAGGVQNAIWNTGFSAADPTVPAHNGSEQGHILVPDSRTGDVPEPATLALIAAGAGLMIHRRRSSKLS